MTYLMIALPEAMKDFVDLQVSSGMYSTADEFLAALIEREQGHQAKQKVNSLLRTTDRMYHRALMLFCMQDGYECDSRMP